MESTVTRAGAVSLENATRARIRFEHGAGQLVVRSGADPNLLLGGEFGEHAEMVVRREGEQVEVVLRAVGGDWRELVDPTSWSGPHRPFDWDVQLNPAVSLTLDFAIGASKNVLDLSRLRVTQVVLNTGMSDTELTVPAAAGLTTVEVHAGLADVRIRVPSGVAARIRGKVGLGSLDVDPTRFHPTADGFESPDFAAAQNRVLVHVDGGLESVKIR
ncbi:MAG TPA: hypothetical protein VFZ25_21500 [Chloroflexota bacterium]|nr:hypothetical protein [Chloroflexota bacterium]